MSENVDLFNLAIWVNGNTSQFHGLRSEFDKLVSHKLRPIVAEISSLDKLILRHHKKKIKGREYWYLWDGERWVSKGSVEKGDPRAPHIAERDNLQMNLKTQEELMRSCVLKVIDNHVVFDVLLFKKHIDKKLPDGTIVVGDLVEICGV